jgi:flagellar biosynthesis protein FlgN
MLPVTRILDSEIEAVRRLLSLLEDEQKALRDATPELLSQIGPQKAELITRLNQLEEQRVAQLPDLGNKMNPQLAMSTWLGQQKSDDIAHSLWSTLLELARQAKTTNELNGKLVALHLQHTNQALSALSRQTDPGLYGSNGQASTLTGSRIVDSA